MSYNSYLPGWAFVPDDEETRRGEELEEEEDDEEFEEDGLIMPTNHFWR